MLVVAFLLSGFDASYVDDTLITYTYATNLAEHGSLTWWVGPEQPAVDGFTSLLHVLLLALGMSLGVDVAFANSIICFGSYLGILVIFLSATRQHPTFPRIAGFAIVVLNASFLFWLSGGLDGLLFSLLFFASYVAVEHAKGARRFNAWTAIILILLTLARPEGMLIAIALVLYWFVNLIAHRHRLDILWPLSVLAAIIGQAFWRWVNYGAIVPNTYFAKRSASLFAELLDGTTYFSYWLTTAGGVILLVSVFAWLLLAGTLLRALMVVGMIALVIVEGGDPHPMYRFLMPIIPLVALDTSCVLALGNRTFKISAVALLAGYLAIQVTTSMTVKGHIAGQEELAAVFDRIKTGAWPFRTVRDDGIANFRALAVAEIDKVIPRGVPIVGADVGALAYFSSHQIIDAAGLNDRTIAHLPKPQGKHNLWGTFRLDYLVEQKQPIMVLSFPSLTNVPLGSDLQGRSCNATELRVTHGVTSFQEELLPDYQCASHKADDGKWVNFLVRNSAVSLLPPETLITQCMPELIHHCN